MVPAAVALWLGALLGLLWTWWAALACGVAAVLVSGALLAKLRPAASPWWSGGVALLVAGLLLVGPLSLRLNRAEHDPLRGLAEHGTEVTLRVLIRERPAPIRSAGYADQQAGPRSAVVAAEVLHAERGAQPVVSVGRVALLAPFDSWRQVLPGQEITARGELAPPRDADLTVAAVYVRGPPSGPTEAPWWQRGAEAMREALRRACHVLPEEQAGLVPGLVVGDTSGLSERLDREFTDAGLTHLMAVSGSNVAIVCGAVLLLLRLLRAGPRLSAGLAGVALAGFVVLAGGEPSVLRAAVMGAIALLALALGRERSVVPALAAATGALVAWDPAMAVSFGFALSVIATAGLVLLAPWWAEVLQRRGVPPGVAEGLAIPAAAFVVTAPVVAGMAGQLSVVSVAANVLAAPVVAPATVFGVLATVAAVVWPSGGEVVARLAGPEAGWLIVVARRASEVPGAVLPWPGGWWGGLLALVVATAVVLALRRRGLRVLLALILVGALLIVVPGKVIAPGWPPARWTVVACDVGQGDALVLATGEPGRAVVVDAGPEPGPVDRCLDRLGIERVPLVMLSHLHADHIGGLDSVFEGRTVGAVAVGPGRQPDWAWRQVGQIAMRHRVPLLELEPGRRLEWPALTLEVLGPGYVSEEEDDDGTQINNGSVVLRAGTPAGRVLLTGDVELAAQADLLASGADLRADVIKVPHHGSRFSLPQFLAAVSARLALVSVGSGNRYGHPNRTTLDTLTADGALVARTDTDGDTAVIPDQSGPAVVRRGK
nr:ComEC/Rec2 family competence protein [Amycolatopsis granulosa]